MALHVEGNEAFFTGETLTTLYYVTQEALTNTQKHARANQVSIEVCFGETEAKLAIRDDGFGFHVVETADANRGADGGYGLHTMERLTRVGGRLSIVSQPGAGTTVSAYAPQTLLAGTASAALPSLAPDQGVKAS